jgi:hypothetical protein
VSRNRSEGILRKCTWLVFAVFEARQVDVVAAGDLNEGFRLLDVVAGEAADERLERTVSPGEALDAAVDAMLPG